MVITDHAKQSARLFHLCPGLHEAAKIAIFRVFAKNRKIRKSGDFSRIFRFFAFLCHANVHFSRVYYQSKQTNCKSQFPLYISVRLAAKSKKAVFWPKIVTKNWVIESHRQRRTPPPIPISKVFCVGPPSPTSELNQWLYLLICLQVKTRPNCLRRSWTLSTERAKRWLNSRVNRHVCFEACLTAQLARKYLSPLFLQRLAFTPIPA